MSDKAFPPVVLIILTCNQRELTLQCLQSLEKCGYPNKQIVLVDNGSTDQTAQAVNKKFAKVHYIKNEKNLGAAAGRNVGIEYAKAHLNFEYVMFMDNDIVVTPGFLDLLIKGLLAHQTEGVEIASPKLYLMGQDKVIDCAGGAKVNFYLGSTQTRGHGEEDRGQYDTEKFPQCVPTTVLMHRKALFRAGGFDTTFDPYGYEDLDMVLRANIPGSPFLFVPAATVYHKGSRTGFTGYSGEYTKVKASNFRKFLQRHSTRTQRVVFFTILPFLAIKPLIRELRKGNVKTIIGLIKGFVKKE